MDYKEFFFKVLELMKEDNYRLLKDDFDYNVLKPNNELLELQSARHVLELIEKDMENNNWNVDSYNNLISMMLNAYYIYTLPLYDEVCRKHRVEIQQSERKQNNKRKLQWYY